MVVLEPELAEMFPNTKAVNEALRGLLDVTVTTARLTRRSTGRVKQQRVGQPCVGSQERPRGERHSAVQT
ncbi:MAG: hypothetical protein CCU26_16395 [Nitrospira sp. UW-LDO-01]|nr:hypothetical protein [Nitrospira sp.]OYT18539.1 MAG: hypothetical protein CCU26_16395 [Nitrospira sp. UW-LDO-01]